MPHPRSFWLIASVLCLCSLVARPSQDVWAQPAQGQKEHEHRAPHGGQMVTAGKYHLELVVQGQQTVQVYLYDDAEKPLPVPTPEVTLYLRLPGNKQHTLTLKAGGGAPATMWATNTDVLRDAPTFDAALRVTLDGETRNFRFSSKGEHTHKDGQPGAPHKH